jgi:hypothetical protein
MRNAGLLSWLMSTAHSSLYFKHRPAVFILATRFDDRVSQSQMSLSLMFVVEIMKQDYVKIPVLLCTEYIFQCLY